MARNLDLTSLRSFVTVADLGGVTRASSALNLTQSAVSMQLKRLEEGLGVGLLDRSSRAVALTAAGEQLVGYARRMLALNDEALSRLMDDGYEGELVIGVPHDIVYPHIPHVLQSFAASFPRMKVQLISSFTRGLKQQFASGECDLILTTESELGPGGKTLCESPLVWVGAPGGNAWKSRPLRLAFEHNCIFRREVQRALDKANIDWEMAVESNSTRTIEASVSADLAVHAMVAGSEPPYFERVPHGGSLPELTRQKINIYVQEGKGSEPLEAMADLLTRAYAGR
ncbi:MAG: LysR substrate-binding domain-containing protein [Pseudomonadota bacterium]